MCNMAFFFHIEGGKKHKGNPRLPQHGWVSGPGSGPGWGPGRHSGPVWDSPGSYRPGLPPETDIFYTLTMTDRRHTTTNGVESIMDCGLL